MRIVAAALLGIATLAPAPADASFYTVKQLIDYCRDGDRSGELSLLSFGLCQGFILGAVGTVEVTRVVVVNKSECLPDRIRAEDLKDVILGAMISAPEIHHMPAAFGVSWAMSQTYCRGK